MTEQFIVCGLKVSPLKASLICFLGFFLSCQAISIITPNRGFFFMPRYVHDVPHFKPAPFMHWIAIAREQWAV